MTTPFSDVTKKVETTMTNIDLGERAGKDLESARTNANLKEIESKFSDPGTVAEEFAQHAASQFEF